MVREVNPERVINCAFFRYNYMYDTNPSTVYLGRCKIDGMSIYDKKFCNTMCTKFLFKDNGSGVEISRCMYCNGRYKL